MNDYLQESAVGLDLMHAQVTASERDNHSEGEKYSEMLDTAITEMKQYPLKRTAFGKIKYVQE